LEKRSLFITLSTAEDGAGISQVERKIEVPTTIRTNIITINLTIPFIKIYILHFKASVRLFLAGSTTVLASSKDIMLTINCGDI